MLAMLNATMTSSWVINNSNSLTDMPFISNEYCFINNTEYITDDMIIVSE